MTQEELFYSAVALFVLLILSAFFSGSETALTAISRARIHALEKEGSKRAKTVAKLREQKEKLIGAILLGNNMVNIGASALATSIAMELFGYSGVAYATLTMTVLILIFSEVAPKTYAIQNADRVALAVAPIFSVLVKLFYPVTHVVYLLVQGVFRLLGLNRVEGGVSARDTIRGTIDLHHQEGEMLKQDRDMLGSILDLEELDVEDIMVHRKQLDMIDADLPPEDIITHVITSSYTRIPLWREDPDEIIGILHAKDVLRALKAANNDPTKVNIDAIMMPPWFIPESISLKEQLHNFRVRRNHFAIVVDEYGTVQGIITLEDILEEIVGHIDDEHDIEETLIAPQLDGSVIVEGDATIRDLNRQFDWELPDSDASTAAGLVMYEARIIPEVGEVFEFYGFRFRVLEKQNNRLTRLRIEAVKEDASDA